MAKYFRIRLIAVPKETFPDGGVEIVSSIEVLGTAGAMEVVREAQKKVGNGFIVQWRNAPGLLDSSYSASRDWFL